MKTKATKLQAKSVPSMLFLLFFGIVTNFALNLIFVPFTIVEVLIRQVIDPNQTFLGYELSFLLSFTPYIIILLLSYFLLFRIKNVYVFFLITLGILLYSFEYTFRTVSLNPYQAVIAIVLSLILLFFTFTLTYFWKRIYIEKAVEIKRPVVIGIATFSILVLIEALSGLQFSIYVSLGEFIQKLTSVNIFYLDYYGFVYIFTSLVVCIVSWISMLMKPKS